MSFMADVRIRNTRLNEPEANANEAALPLCKLRNINSVKTGSKKKKLETFSHPPPEKSRPPYAVQSSSVSVSYRTTKSLLAVVSLLLPWEGARGAGVGSSRGSSKASEWAELKDGLEGTSTMDKSESSLPTSERVSVVAVKVVVARVALATRAMGPTEGAEVLSGAAWGMMIKEEEEMVPSSSEEL